MIFKIDLYPYGHIVTINESMLLLGKGRLT